MYARKQRLRIAAWAAVVIWMACIFYFSHQPGEESSEHSTVIVQIVSKIVLNEGSPVKPVISEAELHMLIRKLAHLSEYALLGALLVNALRYEIKSKILIARTAAIVGFAYAVSDEFHQLFIPGRSGCFQDVLIDSVGLAFGLAAACRWLLKEKHTPSEKITQH